MCVCVCGVILKIEVEIDFFFSFLFRSLSDEIRKLVLVVDQQMRKQSRYKWTTEQTVK